MVSSIVGNDDLNLLWYDLFKNVFPIFVCDGRLYMKKSVNEKLFLLSDFYYPVIALWICKYMM